MLNPYFAFGVPFFLLLLYIGFALFRRSSHIPYLGFVLFIIAGFMSVFSIQQALTEVNKTNAAAVEQVHGYSLYLLAIPLLIGLLLVIRNIFRGYAKIKKVRLQSK